LASDQVEVKFRKRAEEGERSQSEEEAEKPKREENTVGREKVRVLLELRRKAVVSWC
jgi:hypothetical protein